MHLEEATATGDLEVERTDAAGRFVSRQSLPGARLRYVTKRGPCAAGRCAGAPPLSLVVERPGAPRLVLPLARGFTLHTSHLSHGRLSVRALLQPPSQGLAAVLVMLSAAPEAAPQMRLFATCLREDRLASEKESAAALRHTSPATACATSSLSSRGDDLISSLALRSTTVALSPGRAAGSLGVSRALSSAPASALESEAAEALELTSEQQSVVTAVLARRGGVFFTGSAGTGKSLVLLALRRAVPEAHFAASTGVAATAVGGCTLHAWAGVGMGAAQSWLDEAARLGDALALARASRAAPSVVADATAALAALSSGPLLEAVVDSVRRRRDAVARWRQCRTLVVDEISMVDADFFDLLSLVGQRIRLGAPAPSASSSAPAAPQPPFGGLQVVLAGDFFQLPPVGRHQQARRFAFEGSAWPLAVRDVIVLSRVFRQGGDALFVALLNEVRLGVCSDETVRLLQARWMALSAPPLDPAHLSTAPEPASTSSSLAAIRPTRLQTHRADVDRENAEQLRLLPGECVLIRAADRWHAQAPAQGDGEAGAAEKLAQLLDGACPAPRELRLKVGAQVMLTKTLDAAAGLVNGARGVVLGFGLGAARSPTVRFRSGADVVVRVEFFAVQQPGRSQAPPLASRSQLPLALAWALSVHKAQGMTLDVVEVSLARCFEPGQAYVALSRARSLAGLSLLEPFAPACVRASPAVLAFYARGCRPLPAARPSNAASGAASRRGSDGGAGAGREAAAATAARALVAAAAAAISAAAPPPAPAARAPVATAVAPASPRPNPLLALRRSRAAALSSPGPVPAWPPAAPSPRQALGAAPAARAAASPSGASPPVKRAHAAALAASPHGAGAEARAMARATLAYGV